MGSSTSAQVTCETFYIMELLTAKRLDQSQQAKATQRRHSHKTNQDRTGHGGVHCG